MKAKPTVLLVDDMEANLLALEVQLTNLRCDLVRASSGLEALQRLQEGEFAVLLLDVQMPEMDGYEVAKYARERPETRHVPIIFLTAMHEDEAEILRGYGTGAVDFLFKPVNPYVLRSKVQIFLDLYASRQKLAEEVEAHKRTLAELEAFNYSVSHDLRAPLRPLAGFSQALLEDWGDKLDPTAKDYLLRIRNAARRMGQLIDDLLRLSRINRELRAETIDLSALASGIFSELSVSDPARQVEWEVEPGLSTTADAGLLRIALENLLRNAWKFTNERTPSRIAVGKRLKQHEAAYFVRDNGIGFNPQFAGKLFQPFQRLHTDSEFEGTGIGLAIVRRIVELHGGRIWVEAAPGAGATFYFTLNVSARAPDRLSNPN